MKKLVLGLLLFTGICCTSCEDKTAENAAFAAAYSSSSPSEVAKFLEQYPKADQSRIDSIKTRLEFVKGDSLAYAAIVNEQDPEVQYQLARDYEKEFMGVGEYLMEVEFIKKEAREKRELKRFADAYMNGVYYSDKKYPRAICILFEAPNAERKGVAKFESIISEDGETFYSYFGLCPSFVGFTKIELKNKKDYSYEDHETALYKHVKSNDMKVTMIYDYELQGNGRVKCIYRERQLIGKGFDKLNISEENAPRVLEIEFRDDGFLMFADGKYKTAVKYWL